MRTNNLSKKSLHVPFSPHKIGMILVMERSVTIRNTIPNTGCLGCCTSTHLDHAVCRVVATRRQVIRPLVGMEGLEINAPIHTVLTWKTQYKYNQF